MNQPARLAAVLSVLTAVAASPLIVPARADEPTDKALLKQLLQGSSTPPADAPDSPKAPAQPAAPSDQAPPTTPAPGVSPAADPSAPAAAVDNSPLTEAEKTFWHMHWFAVASHYAKLHDQYALCAKWDQRYPSSAHKMPEQWQAENTTTSPRTSGGIVYHDKFVPPRAEADAAAKVLPDLAPNQYGYIHSGKVAEIVSPTEMVLTDIQLVDADRIQKEIQSIQQRGDTIIRAQKEQQRIAEQRAQQEARNSAGTYQSNRNTTSIYDTSNDLKSSDVRKGIEMRYKQRETLIKQQSKYSAVKVRVIGFPTTATSVGSTWTGLDPRGPQIAVMQTSDKPGRTGVHRSFGSRDKELIAVNADLLRKGISEDQFTELLAQRGMTRRDFINLARTTMRNTPGGVEAAIPNIIVAMEQAKAKYLQDHPAAPAAGDKSAASGSDFMKQKYGSHGDAPGSTPAGADKKDGDKPADASKSFLEEKYGKKKAADSGDAGDKSKSSADGDFLKKKYGDKKATSGDGDKSAGSNSGGDFLSKKYGDKKTTKEGDGDSGGAAGGDGK